MRRASALLVCAALGIAACGREGGEERPSTAESRGAKTSWKGFGPSNWPPARWRPYADSSPFNRPFTRADRTHPRSEAMVAQLLEFGEPAPLTAGFSQTPNDWGHPTFYAEPDDPVFTLRTTAPWGPNPIDGHRIRIPDAARPAGGGDGHMTIVTPEGWEYDLWQVRSKPAGGGTLTFSWGGRVRIDGNGLRAGGTASRFGNLAGVIRAQELRAGRINHALFVVTDCTSRETWFGHGVRPPRSGTSGSFVYPAVAGGALCPAGVAAPPMGARIRLAMTRAEIDRLGRPRWQTAILRALARYGGYIGDTGGPGFAFMFESSTTYTAYGRPDPLVQIAREAGLPSHDGRYAFPVADGVDWARHLRVTVPPRRVSASR